MTEKDVISTLKKSIREELSKESDELIEDLCHAFRDQLVQNKHILISKMLDEIEILVSQNVFTHEVVFQINIKRGANNGG